MFENRERVIIVHPAWSLCGSYEVFKSQVRAFHHLGATVESLAVGRNIWQNSQSRRFWRHYYRDTANLDADRLFHTGPSLWWPKHRKSIVEFFRARRFDHAAAAALPATLSPIPKLLLSDSRPVSHIHCNHYFNMPIARKLAIQFDCPVILETHDLQSHQFALRGERDLFSNSLSALDAMMDSELRLMRDADVLVHMNSDEMQTFQKLLPDKLHILLYPHVSDLPSVSPKFALIVAAGNYPNYLSVRWFLTEILPKLNGVPVRIVGGVLDEFRTRAPALVEKHNKLFAGHVIDLADYYRGAMAIALPTIAGHGISVKSIEALTWDLPIVATSLAFRGVETDFGCPLITFADHAAAFAAALNRLGAEEAAGSMPAFRSASTDAAETDVRPSDLYKAVFSFEAYLTNMADLVSLVKGKASGRLRVRNSTSKATPADLESARNQLIAHGGEAFESMIEAIYRKFVHKGGVVLDGGANIGRHTIPMSRVVGLAGKVIAVEPLPEIAERVSDRIRALGIRNVDLHRVALSDKIGQTTFHHVKDLPAYSGIELRPFPGTSSVEVITVPLSTIDALFADALRLDFIKLDLEGGEFDALKGGLQTIARTEPLLIFESGRGEAAQIYGYSKADWFGLFDGLGYYLFDIVGRRFSEAQWDEPDIPWYLIGYRTGSTAEGFCGAHLDEIVLSTARELSVRGPGQ